MKVMTTIYADVGMVLTDGENYGTTMQLAEGRTAEGIKEITKAEYEAIIAAEEMADGGNE